MARRAVAAPGSPGREGPHRQAGRARDAEITCTDPDALNEQWFVADEGGKLFVCRFVPTIWGDERRLEITHYTTTQFKEKFRRFRWTSQTGMAKPTTVYLAEQWLRSPARRQYERVIFSPGQDPGPGTLNLWRGFAVRPAPGEFTPIWEHVVEVICSGDTDRADYLFRWPPTCSSARTAPAWLSWCSGAGKG